MQFVQLTKEHLLPLPLEFVVFMSEEILEDIIQPSLRPPEISQSSLPKIPLLTAPALIILLSPDKIALTLKLRGSIRFVF